MRPAETVAHVLDSVLTRVRTINELRKVLDDVKHYGRAPLPVLPRGSTAEAALAYVAGTRWNEEGAGEALLGYLGVLRHDAVAFPEAFPEAWEILDVIEVLRS